MYDDVLFPVSFYLLDHNELAEHAVEMAKSFDARLHLLSLTLSDEGREDVEDHTNAFDGFVTRLESEGVDVSSELRDEPVGYGEVPDVIRDESTEYDLVMMGHTKVREGEARATAENVINSVSVPVVVVPLSTPRFRDV